MPNPKHKISRSRGRKRRTHQKLTAPATSNCSNCGAPTLMHRVCTECGYYRGVLAIEKQVAV